MNLTQNPQIIEVAPFQIIGISLSTTNEGGKSSQDIGMLWQRFHSDKLAEKIPYKDGDTVYSIYTDYTSDHQGKFTSIIGCKVSALDNIPPDMIGRKFHGGKYRKFTASGKLPEAIATAWRSIWEQDKSLNRAYTTDFEIYDQRSANFEHGEVDIFIAVE